jgi:small GTP-binding protein
MTNEEVLQKIEEAKASGATELNLSSKGISLLPLEIYRLRNLKKLNLSHNHLSFLSPNITLLTNLVELNLSNNQFIQVPKEIYQITGLKKLNLSRNNLTLLHPEIVQLTNLQVINLGSNQFSSFPKKLFQMRKLLALGLGELNLTALPQEIFQLKTLKALSLESNQLHELPSEICQLPKLKSLYLSGNPLTSPPLEIAEKGIEAIRQYFSSLQAGKQPLNEVKILLLGDGAAGKTSLVKQLLGQPFDEHEDTTHGISIQGWEPPCAGRQIRVNAWDFGGQEIQHATHQFFLSKRSLYVLVLDGRKDERTEYWLRYVEAFGGDSPVLIVLNKMDSNPSFDVNRSFLLEKYPGIREFFRISCKTGRGVAEFRKALLTELAQVEMIHIPWPAAWFAVKRRLEQLDKPYISAEEYGSLCREAAIADKETRETLVEFFNDLGVAVHFRELDLKSMHVLDPVWVTEAVYKIITAEEMAKSTGLLHVNCLGEILPQGEEESRSYPPDTHPFILRLMEKFELCYPVGREAVLIPQLLPVPEPELAFTKDGSLRFALHYPDFLPPSVFPRFMVKVHKDIHDETRWRTGVLLADKRSGSQAVVKADTEARRINIWVQGETPREYLHYLRYLLTDINSGFEKLTVMELVPMPDDKDSSADYATLLEYAKNDIDKYIPTGSAKVYSVHELLGLVQPKDKAELVRLADKTDPELDEKASWLEMTNDLSWHHLQSARLL